MDPEQEYELMLQGVPVNTHPKENKSWHLIKHTLQAQMLENNRENDPELMVRLVNHIEQTRRDIMDITSDPRAAAAQFMQEEATRSAQGQKSLPAPLNMGQNLPANMGAQMGTGGASA
jgi:hypothetical protein